MCFTAKIGSKTRLRDEKDHHKFASRFHVVFCIILLFIYMLTVVDHLPRLGKRELICLPLFTCNYVVFV